MDTNRYGGGTPPILLIAFNRPELTARMLDRIRTSSPTSLYVACDGPRVGRHDDLEKIDRIHAMVAAIDWCKCVKTLFRPTNLGCGLGESTAMSWFLSEAEEGIILEDDTLPDPSFFPFCGEMLDRYRATTNVMQVSGYNFLSGRHETQSDYIFSQGGFSWGWATWRRAWVAYDFQMKTWPEFKKLGFHRVFPFNPEDNKIFDQAYAGNVDTWDYQWNYIRSANSGLSIVPKFSLVENIGFGVDGAHGVGAAAGQRYRAVVRPMPSPLVHPPFVFADHHYDRLLVRSVQHKSPMARLERAAANMLRRKAEPRSTAHD